MAIKIEKNYIKNVTTNKFMSQHNDELKAEIFVATIRIHVAILIEEKRLEDNYKMYNIFEDCRNTVRAKELIYVTTFQTYVAT